MWPGAPVLRAGLAARRAARPASVLRKGLRPLLLLLLEKGPALPHLLLLGRGEGSSFLPSLCFPGPPAPSLSLRTGRPFSAPPFLDWEPSPQLCWDSGSPVPLPLSLSPSAGPGSPLPLLLSLYLKSPPSSLGYSLPSLHLPTWNTSPHQGLRLGTFTSVERNLGLLAEDLQWRDWVLPSPVPQLRPRGHASCWVEGLQPLTVVFSAQGSLVWNLVQQWLQAWCLRPERNTSPPWALLWVGGWEEGAVCHQCPGFNGKQGQCAKLGGKNLVFLPLVISTNQQLSPQRGIWNLFRMVGVEDLSFFLPGKVMSSLENQRGSVG